MRGSFALARATERVVKLARQWRGRVAVFHVRGGENAFRYVQYESIRYWMFEANPNATLIGVYDDSIAEIGGLEADMIDMLKEASE